MQVNDVGVAATTGHGEPPTVTEALASREPTRVRAPPPCAAHATAPQLVDALAIVTDACGAATQLAATVAPGGEKEPAVHGVQSAAVVASVPSTAVRYVFAAQSRHAYCFGSVLYVPEGHASHAPAPTEEIFPASQSAQLIAGLHVVPATKPATKVPRPQSAQVGWPDDG